MDKKSQNLNFFVLKMIRYASGSFYVKIQMSHFCDIEALRSMNVLLPHFSFILCRYLISGSPFRELWSYRGFRWSDINAYFMDNTRPWRNIKVHQFSKISILSWRQIIFPIKESRRQLLLIFYQKEILYLRTFHETKRGDWGSTLSMIMRCNHQNSTHLVNKKDFIF